MKSPAKPRGYGEYMADCPVHGRSERRMDRWDHVLKFFDGHAKCRWVRLLRGGLPHSSATYSLCRSGGSG